MPSAKHPVLIVSLVIAIGGVLYALWSPNEVNLRDRVNHEHWRHAEDFPDCSCVHDHAVSMPDESLPAVPPHALTTHPDAVPVSAPEARRH